MLRNPYRVLRKAHPLTGLNNSYLSLLLIFGEKIMRRIFQVAGWISLMVIFSSCTQTTTPTVAPLATTAIPTASSVKTTVTLTPSTPYPTVTQTNPPVLTNTPTLTSFEPIFTQDNEQVYIDPEGWYSVNIPSDWQEESPGSFKGENGFFETGYLPEMMFMQRTTNICHWLANIAFKSTYFIKAPTYLSDKANNCTLTTLPEIMPATVQAIIENPNADYEHRFFYIKTDAEHYDEIRDSFAWLQPVDPGVEPVHSTVSLSPEDISFWEKTGPTPFGYSITEYELSDEAQKASPSEKIFLEFIPPEARLEVHHQGNTSSYSPDTWESIDEEISYFGYKLRPTENDSSFCQYKLFKEDVLVLDNIYELPSIYRFSTPEGEKIIFVVRTVKDPNQTILLDNVVSYLVQNDSITIWGDRPSHPVDPGLPPILTDDEFLWLKIGKHTHVQVQNNQREVLFSFATYFGSRLPVEGFKSWSNHWILLVGDYMIKDGEIINEEFGFEEVFNWYLINDKPFYFFRKGSRIGISYDGQFFPTNYNYIPHNYCCGLGLNNPRMVENTIRFFGKRDNIWYFVVVDFN